MGSTLAGKRRLDKAARKELARRVKRARKTLVSDGSPLKARVHEARRELKKARAALLLLRPRLPRRRFERERTALRDAGRALSTIRDAQVLPNALATLLKASHADPADFSAARRTLEQAARRAGSTTIVEGAAGPLRQARRSLRKLRVGPRHWRAVSAGLRHVYDQGRTLLQACVERGRDEDFHEWRKAAKYLRYQLDLFADDRDAELTGYCDGLHRLTDLLGDDHDLGQLHAAIQADPKAFGGQRAAATLETMIHRRRATLRAQAVTLGEELYALAPKAAERAWHTRWLATLS